MTLAFSRNELDSYLQEVFPEVWSDFALMDLTETTVRIRLKTGPRHVRPGGSVSGPSIFALADLAMYAMVLARAGRQSLAVTTNCSLDFMRKPALEADVVAECRLLKFGRVLAVGDVLMFSEGDTRPVARASLTYSLPPQGSEAASAG